MSAALASPMYSNARAVRTAQPSESTAVLDETVARKVLRCVARTNREEEYRQALEALVSCGPQVDVPTDEDLKSRGVRIRF
jgi:hypothetical protein